MGQTEGNISRLDIPFENLVLTGFVGVGKTTVGRLIARRLQIDFLDIDEEIVYQEIMSIAKIRELYGDSRLRKLEYEFCRQAALMRRSVVVVSGAALLDPRNYQALSETGRIVVLTCQLGEALRRMHLASEVHYRDAAIRQRTLSRLRREIAIVNDPRLLQFDTTHLSIEQTADLLINYWLSGSPQGEWFRYGPPEPIKPPRKTVVGLSDQGEDILLD